MSGVFRKDEEGQCRQLQCCGDDDGGDNSAVEDEVEELLCAVLDAEDGVALVLHVVQDGGGSDHEEAEDEGQLK